MNKDRLLDPPDGHKSVPLFSVSLKGPFITLDNEKWTRGLRNSWNPPCRIGIIFGRKENI